MYRPTFGAPMLALLVALLAGCNSPQEPQVVREMGCEKGNMDHCFELGRAALTRARPDIRTARTLFSKGCNVHHPPSCNALAEMVRDAKGGPPDPKRSAELFQIACTGGIQSACVNLGVSLYDGWGVKADPEKAVGLFVAACDDEKPSFKACSALGVAWSQGKGVAKKDLAMAEELHIRACDGQYAPGCVHAGMLFHGKTSGKRVENQTAAVEFLEKACKIDQHFGCFELASLHEKRQIPDATDLKAAEFYQKTCNMDPTRGCYEAARLMELGKVVAREGEIESLYNVACEHGHTAACSKRSLDL